jgi:hypothetical protein
MHTWKKPVSLEASIHISTICEWFHQEKELQLMVNDRGYNAHFRTRLDGNGRKPTINKEVENTLMEWFDNLRNMETDDGPVKVTVNMCMQQIWVLDPSLVNVQCHLLRRRLWRVLHRRNVVERQITHQAQKTRNNRSMGPVHC